MLSAQKLALVTELKAQLGESRYSEAIAPEVRPDWCLSVLKGRLCEVAQGGSPNPMGASRAAVEEARRCSGALTLTCALILEAQENAQPVAWVTRAVQKSGAMPARRVQSGPRALIDPGSCETRLFFPPDAAALGIDLAALVIVCLPAWSGEEGLLRVVQHLLLSGAFGLVVVDYQTRLQLPTALVARLSSLAQLHDTALLWLTTNAAEANSVSELVSLKVSVTTGPGEKPFERRMAIHAHKDKRSGPGWSRQVRCRSIPGLP